MGAPTPERRFAAFGVPFGGKEITTVHDWIAAESPGYESLQRPSGEYGVKINLPIDGQVRELIGVLVLQGNELGNAHIFIPFATDKEIEAEYVASNQAVLPTSELKMNEIAEKLGFEFNVTINGVYAYPKDIDSRRFLRISLDRELWRRQLKSENIVPSGKTDRAKSAKYMAQVLLEKNKWKITPFSYGVNLHKEITK